MIVLRKNDIPSVVGDNSGRDKAEREDMDARGRKERSKSEWLKERARKRETRSRVGTSFLEFATVPRIYHSIRLITARIVYLTHVLP